MSNLTQYFPTFVKLYELHPSSLILNSHSLTSKLLQSVLQHSFLWICLGNWDYFQVADARDIALSI